MNGRKTDIEPDIDLPDEDEDATLPDSEPLELSEGSSQSLAAGRSAIERYAKDAPMAPGVYRMVDTGGDVLYVGKAKSIRKRITSYARPAGHDTRIERMIAATHHIEFVTTRTETEALLLEANLIKRLRPRFNVLMRDDKSFPYILITADHPAPQIIKHRGARNRPGDYFGPFASVWAVNRTITALQRAFLIRSCSDAVYESRTRPCLLHQIKRCSAPCTGEIKPEDYAELVREARGFLSGKSQAVKELLGEGNGEGVGDARLRARRDLSRPPCGACRPFHRSRASIRAAWTKPTCSPIHQAGGFHCVQVFFFRTGQNWGNRAYFPKADRSLSAAEVLSSFLAQFYDDKPCPRTILISEDFGERELLAEALTPRADTASRSRRPSAAKRRISSITRSPMRARRWGESSRRPRRNRNCSRRWPTCSSCRACRAGSRSMTTATSRDRTRSAP